jgi:O-succinylhomoserine sulfhydrylase
MARDYGPDTLAVRAGGLRSDFQEHSEALALTASFVFASAGQAARRFANEEPGNIYSRFTNPTVAMFQSRLAALEGAEACVATSTGMAAVATLAMGLLSAGDHMIAARGVFGTVVPLFNQILGRFGVETTWVDAKDLDAWRAALRPRTKLLFAETPSNPVCEIVDIAGLAAIAKHAGAILAIDNCMCSPALQRPIALGADLVVHSATKYIDGQGRVLGGAIAGRRDLVEGPLFSFVRTAGPALSPFNAWVCLKGLETMRLRVEAQSATALELARWLEGHPAIERVNHPGLAAHPQHALAMR